MATPLQNGFIRVAGVSGCLSLVLSTIWYHGLKKHAEPHAIDIFENAKSMHMFSTVGLLAVPFTRYPNMVGCLLCTGMLLFCGSCYISVMTGNTWITRVAPYGGMMMMAGWLCMAL